MNGLRGIEKHASIGTDPIAAEPPEDFEIVRNQSLVLFALPQVTRSVTRFVFRCITREIVECLRRPNQITAVIEKSRVCECRYAIEASIVRATFDIGRQKVTASRR